MKTIQKDQCYAGYATDILQKNKWGWRVGEWEKIIIKSHESKHQNG